MALFFQINCDLIHHVFIFKILSMFRTKLLNEVTKKDSGKTVTISGWVNRRRDHGGIIFVDLRDRYGVVQIHSDPQKFKEAHATLDQCRSEFVIKVEGTVMARPDDMINPNMDSGEIEVMAEKVEILTASQTPPFEVDQDKDISEELRLKYRYIDLRRERVKANMIARSKIFKYIRDFMDKEDFLEIETPIMIKGTPEGSREYIVPSRLYPDNFYVLPQSPQQLKQLLMVAGYDKYFQLARCFRDEDQRGDRQPEFTQLDIEMSFVEMEDVIEINERLIKGVFETFAKGKKIDKEIVRLTYEEAMNSYGSDKPDMRFDMPLSDISDLVETSEFGVFANTVTGGGVVKGLRVEKGAEFTRKQIDDLEAYAKELGAKGLAYLVLQEDGGFKSPIAKFFKEEELKAIAERCDAVKGDIIFFAADRWVKCCEYLGAARLRIGDELKLRDPERFVFCWVTHFPLFEYDDAEENLNSVHHPFTSPSLSDLELLDTEPEKALSESYDIVVNGVELGGGSIRIHDAKLQAKMFKILGISDEDAERRFGHILKAFTYGVPPHGGIAWGLDRLVMIIQGEPNIREVIPFPKDQQARDLMLGAPSQLPMETLREANISLLKKDKK
jgi:aspartyl-tRNA synthetase